eukprot:765159-Hanusia_phi.AAC.2
MNKICRGGEEPGRRLQMVSPPPPPPPFSEFKPIFLCRTLKAALKGYELAKFNAGYCYHTGEETSPSSLADCLQGLGTEKNTEEAMRWYKEAAEKGHKLVICSRSLLLCESEN